MPKIRMQQDIAYRFDLIPDTMRLREHFWASLRSTAFFYGFEPIRVSPFEDPRRFASLIKAGMFHGREPLRVFVSANQEVLIRPSGLLSLLRAYGAQRMSEWAHPVKLYHEGERFWYEGGRDEKRVGRGFDVNLLIVGEETCVAEAQVIQVVWRTLEEMGIDMKAVRVFIQPLGCGYCFGQFRSALGSYVRGRSAGLCRECKRSLKGIPVRIFSCREERCSVVAAHAPQILDYLCEACRRRLRNFFEFLDEIRIPYEIRARDLEKRLQYDIFTFQLGYSLEHTPADGTEVERNEGTPDLSKKDEGRKDKFFVHGGRVAPLLLDTLTGRKVDAVACVVDEDLLADAFSAAYENVRVRPRVFLAQLGDLARRKSLALFEGLRKAGILVVESLGKDAIKSQLKMAENVGAEFAVIVGQKEALDETVIVREVESGIQETVPQEKMVEFLKKKLKR